MDRFYDCFLLLLFALFFFFWLDYELNLIPLNFIFPPGPIENCLLETGEESA